MNKLKGLSSFSDDNNWNKILIVFDYNGTLAKRVEKSDYSHWEKDVLERRLEIYSALTINEERKSFIFHRPGIKELREFFEVNKDFMSYSIWTSKNEEYMKVPLQALKEKFDFVPEKVWCGDFIKDLRRINSGYNVDNTILVDDSVFKANMNRNFINIKNFRLKNREDESKRDCELFKLIDYFNEMLKAFKIGTSIQQFMSYEPWDV